MSLQTPAGSVRPGDFLVVVHDFDARGPDELTLRRGEKIELVELDDGFGDGWYLGKAVKTGTIGLFPGVYTTVAPKVVLPQQTDAPESIPQRDRPTVERDRPATADASVSSPKSTDSTPQASRHASVSDLRSPDTPLATGLPSPKQQQPRSTSSPLPSAPMASDVQQSFKQSIDSHLNGQDSPVMNETLSVIDEHITHLSTPRHSVTAQDPKPVTDSGSEYSSHLDHRLSYINGHETDEEEENQPTEAEVRKWNHTETAKHLRDLGIEAKHSEIFEEQEISGDVLLDMNQDFILMKEFDFGVMGRRLKTWHKIKAFQEETKGLRQPSRGSVSSYPSPAEERSLSRAGHTGTFLPRIPSLSERSIIGRQQSRSSMSSMQHPRFIHSGMHSNTSSPQTPQTPPYGIDTQRRPSAASVRDINHSRRHSSIDTTGRSAVLSDPTAHSYHQKQSSFDKTWTLAGASQRQPSRPGTSRGTPPDVLPPHHIFRGAETNESDSPVSMVDRYDDLDRGYFSGPEADARKGRRVLKKRSTTALHTKEPSFDDEMLRINPVNKRHSRIGSADSIREAASHVSSRSAAKAYHGTSKGRFRSFSTRITDRPGQTPNTTEKSAASGGILSSFVGKTETDSSGRSSPMPFQQIKNAAPKFRRAMGFRAVTDVVGRGIDTAVASASPVKENDPSSARTGSTTPSATSKSSERHSTDGSGKATEAGALLPRPKAGKAGPKSKKHTSAYTQGLEKKTPEEQISGCDYSGWMKKRSSNLMTTWKPRLFVLRGRRLSYYYSENDTEERGLIDITAHRVLRADKDPIIALHATITGATVSSTAPPSSAESASPGKAPTSEPQLKGEGDGPFFFKLVPPKMGASRTVQFTKPAIHYFQVDNVKQGRLWMAALMKATIDRDMDIPVEMTNKQKTVSLKQARLMNQRPPALIDAGPKETEKEMEEKPSEEEDAAIAQDGNVDRASGSSEPTEVNSTSKTIGGLEVDTGPSSLLPDDLVEQGKRDD